MQRQQQQRNARALWPSSGIGGDFSQSPFHAHRRVDLAQRVRAERNGFGVPGAPGRCSRVARDDGSTAAGARSASTPFASQACMHVVVGAIVLLHGLIQFIGCAKLWGLAAIPQLSGRAIVPLGETAGRALGALWLLAGLVLVAGGVMLLGRFASWWMVAAAGAALSQALVIVQWHDAKAGTLANVIVIIAVVIAGATSRFHERVADEVRAIFAAASTSDAPAVRHEDIAPLPAPVQRWLERAGIIGRPRTITVRLRQRGELHTSTDAAWMPTEAEQYVTVDRPQFVWQVRSQIANVVPLIGRDKYIDGRGEMLIKAAALVNVARGVGPKIDQGAMLRFLAEMIWYPSAAVEPYLRWEAIDETRARAIMTHEGATDSAVFTIDALGRVTSVTAKRYSDRTGALETWGGRLQAWKRFDGIEIASRGEVVWSLEGGDFTFYRWEIQELEMNTPLVYVHLDDPRRRRVASVPRKRPPHPPSR
jgi:hypothetical protein